MWSFPLHYWFLLGEVHLRKADEEKQRSRQEEDEPQAQSVSLL